MPNDKSSGTPRPQSGSADSGKTNPLDKFFPGLASKNPVKRPGHPPVPRLDKENNPDLIGNFDP